MESQAILQTIRGRTGLDEKAAIGAAEATLQTIGEIMPKNDRERIQRALPNELEPFITESKPDQNYDLDTFYARVAQREGVAMGFGMEHAQAVCQALAEHLEKDDRVFMQKRLPEEYEVLFEAPEIKTVPPHDEQGPTSEREPPVEQPEFSTETPGRPAQSGSVVNSPNPREDRKLSSTSGSPKTGNDLGSGRPRPREGHDLATGDPSRRRPHSDEE
jgi:uncharacterized protein (DUF2267 family)